MKVGDTIAQRHELRATLGSGGLGEVFHAWDTRTRREVTVKVYDAARCPAEARRRFAASVEAAMRTPIAALVLPRVQVGLSAAPPFVVGEALAGEDLAALRVRAGALPWQRAVAIVRSCAEGLAALAKATGAAHRALKPGNVWISPDQEVRLLDFGVAELGVAPVPPRPDGTVAEYRSPEQLGGAAGDVRSDVFTLGVLLFELATGVHPFSGPSSFKAANKLLMQPTPRPAELAPRSPLPSQLEALIARALARQPGERHTDTAELAAHLGLALRAPGTLQRPAPAPATTTPAEPQPADIERDDPSTALSLPVVRVPRPAPLRPASAGPQATAPREDGPPLLALATASQRPAPGPERTAALPTPTASQRPAPGPERTEALPTDGFADPSVRLQSASDDDATIALKVPPRPRRRAPAATATPTSEASPDDSATMAPPVGATPQPVAAPGPTRTGLTPAQWTLIAVNVALLGVIAAGVLWLTR